MEFALAAFLRPFVMLILGITILHPARRAVQRYMKDGKVKQVLLDSRNMTLVIGVVVGYAIIFGIVGYYSFAK